MAPITGNHFYKLKEGIIRLENPRVAQQDGESAEKAPAKGYEQGVSPRRVTGKREKQPA